MQVDFEDVQRLGLPCGLLRSSHGSSEEGSPLPRAGGCGPHAGGRETPLNLGPAVLLQLRRLLVLALPGSRRAIKLLVRLVHEQTFSAQGYCFFDEDEAAQGGRSSLLLLSA